MENHLQIPNPARLTRLPPKRSHFDGDKNVNEGKRRQLSSPFEAQVSSGLSDNMNKRGELLESTSSLHACSLRTRSKHPAQNSLNTDDKTTMYDIGSPGSGFADKWEASGSENNHTVILKTDSTEFNEENDSLSFTATNHHLTPISNFGLKNMASSYSSPEPWRATVLQSKDSNAGTTLSLSPPRLLSHDVPDNLLNTTAPVGIQEPNCLTEEPLRRLSPLDYNRNISLPTVLPIPSARMLSRWPSSDASPLSLQFTPLSIPLPSDQRTCLSPLNPLSQVSNSFVLSTAEKLRAERLNHSGGYTGYLDTHRLASIRTAFLDYLARKRKKNPYAPLMITFFNPTRQNAPPGSWKMLSNNPESRPSVSKTLQRPLAEVFDQCNQEACMEECTDDLHCYRHCRSCLEGRVCKKLVAIRHYSRHYRNWFPEEDDQLEGHDSTDDPSVSMTSEEDLHAADAESPISDYDYDHPQDSPKISDDDESSDESDVSESTDEDEEDPGIQVYQGNSDNWYHRIVADNFSK